MRHAQLFSGVALLIANLNMIDYPRTPSTPAPNIIGVIPARMDSERLPGKVLRPICGRAMVHRVYDAAQSCELFSALYVATDSEDVRGYCTANGIPVIMTAAAHRSGTERIHEVSK